MEENSICQDCGKTWTDEQLNEITHGIWERVAPGEPMPSGECPECGALCQPVPTTPDWHSITFVAGEIFDRLVRFNIIKDHYIAPEFREGVVFIITETIINPKPPTFYRPAKPVKPSHAPPPLILDRSQQEKAMRLRSALQGILDIGKRDMSNPKYDGYFEEARLALANFDAFLTSQVKP